MDLFNSSGREHMCRKPSGHLLRLMPVLDFAASAWKACKYPPSQDDNGRC